MTRNATRDHSYFAPTATRSPGTCRRRVPRQRRQRRRHPGLWNSEHEYGNLRVDGVPAGSVVYSLDGGVNWKALTSGTEFTNAQAKVVAPSYNDIDGYSGVKRGP